MMLFAASLVVDGLRCIHGGGGQDVLVYAEGSPELRHTKVQGYFCQDQYRISD